MKKVYIRTDKSGILFASLKLLPSVNQVYPYRRTMTFFRDFCGNGPFSSLGYEDSYSLGGLSGYRMGYDTPYGYGGFGGLFGSRGFIGFGGLGGNTYGFGYGYPFFSRFGNGFSY